MTTEEQLQELVTELYQEERTVVVPLYPWILIRVLPKELETASGLILPDKQNKPVYEGLVLATYPRRFIEAEGGTAVEVSPQVSVGDHVLFPHYEGMPAPPLDEKKYRLIKEETIHAVLTYTVYPVKLRVTDILVKHKEWGDKVDAILQEFDLIPKRVAPKVLSGV